MNRPREHLDSLLRWLGRREGARFLHIHPRNILIQVEQFFRGFSIPYGCKLIRLDRLDPTPKKLFLIESNCCQSAFLRR